MVDLAPSPQAEKELKELGIDCISVKANVTDYNQVKEAVNSVIGVCSFFYSFLLLSQLSPLFVIPPSSHNKLKSHANAVHHLSSYLFPLPTSLYSLLLSLLSPLSSFFSLPLCFDVRLISLHRSTIKSTYWCKQQELQGRPTCKPTKSTQLISRTSTKSTLMACFTCAKKPCLVSWCRRRGEGKGEVECIGRTQRV